MCDDEYTNTDEKLYSEMNLHECDLYFSRRLGIYVVSLQCLPDALPDCAGSNRGAEGESTQRWVTVQSGGGLLRPTRAEVVTRAVQSGERTPVS
jgi:hypothetical protein